MKLFTGAVNRHSHWLFLWLRVLFTFLISTRLWRQLLQEKKQGAVCWVVLESGLDWGRCLSLAPVVPLQFRFLHLIDCFSGQEFEFGKLWAPCIPFIVPSSQNWLTVFGSFFLVLDAVRKSADDWTTVSLSRRENLLMRRCLLEVNRVFWNFPLMWLLLLLTSPVCT